MILTTWSETARRLSTARVRESFEVYADQVLLFAFTTDRMEVGEHAGGLSFKLVTHGRERYRLGRRAVALEPGRLLLTNPGQLYSSSIEEPRTRAISCFLPPLAPLEGGLVPVAPFRPSPPLAALVATLVGALDAIRPPPLDRLEELTLELGEAATREARGLAPAEAFPAAMRAATRDELVARVLRARDLAHDTAGRVSLARMADHAGLSRYHFLRVFRAVLGTTPARYARGLRLDRGATRLARGEAPAVAARAAGFGSTGTFLRSLRRRR